MQNAIPIRLAALALGAALSTTPAAAQERGYHEVIGVEGDDLLKMRAGPGTNFRIILGLPNGTALYVHSCERSGNTSWCKVSLREARGLRGYVSGAYLRKS
jgi:uncharacterized protein YraI